MQNHQNIFKRLFHFFKMEAEEEHKEEEKLEEKKSEEKKEIHNKKIDLTKMIRKNPWVLSTFVLGIVVLMFLIGNFSGGMTGNVISSADAGNNLVEYLNKVADSEVTLISVEDEGNMYLATIEFKGEEIPLYVTKDGSYYAPNLVPLKIESSSNDQEQQSKEYSEEDLIKLKTFSSCLAEKGLIIYGANWCGWTKKLAVDTLGGFDIAGNAYVECTEEEELCSQEGVTGYPTVKLNGESYSGERTLEALGEATGCNVPELEGTGVTTSSSDASCN